MSMMQLLAVGKSIRTIEDRPTPYKMREQNLLPKFGAGQSAERTCDRKGGEGETSDAITTAEEGSSGSGEAARAVLERATSAAKPGCAVASEGEAPMAYPLGRWTVWKRPAGSKPGNRAVAGPVQGELALQSLTVVRNDLSDADLEIVPAKAAPPEDRPRRVESGREAESMIWSRIVMRIFGAGRT